MTLIVHPVKALRTLHRRYKFLFVLAAAWAPIILSRIPLLACGIVITSTTLFFVSVSNQSTPPTSTGSHHEEL